MNIEITEHPGIGAEFDLSVILHEPWCAGERRCRCGGYMRDRRRSHNVMTSGGLAYLAKTLAYSASVDIADALGHPISTTNLGPVFGAIGSSTAAPAAGDSKLGAETGRTTLASVGVSSGTISLEFFFGLTQGNGTIAEAGLFAAANATANSGTMIDHAAISPSVTKTSSETAIMIVTLTLA